MSPVTQKIKNQTNKPVVILQENKTPTQFSKCLNCNSFFCSLFRASSKFNQCLQNKCASINTKSLRSRKHPSLVILSHNVGSPWSMSRTYPGSSAEHLKETVSVRTSLPGKQFPSTSWNKWYQTVAPHCSSWLAAMDRWRIMSLWSIFFLIFLSLWRKLSVLSQTVRGNSGFLVWQSLKTRVE